MQGATDRLGEDKAAPRSRFKAPRGAVRGRRSGERAQGRRGSTRPDPTRASWGSAIGGSSAVAVSRGGGIEAGPGQRGPEGAALSPGR